MKWIEFVYSYFLGQLQPGNWGPSLTKIGGVVTGYVSKLFVQNAGFLDKWDPNSFLTIEGVSNLVMFGVSMVFIGIANKFDKSKLDNA